MATIEKKVWPPFFQDIIDGRKNFEVRLADFECKPGDILLLREWNPEKGEYTGREIKKEVIYILKTREMKFFSREAIEKHGLQILGLK